MLAIFLSPSVALAQPRAAVVDSTAAKLSALIPPSTTRREALAAVNGVGLDRCIAFTVCLAVRIIQ
jgi:hypothetical protein